MAKAKVDFILNPEIANGASKAILLGDFNNWDTSNGVELKKQKDGSFKASVSLDAGKSYQYRYLLNDASWVNDANAQAYVFQPEFGADNCLITVDAPAKAKKVVAKASAKSTEEAPKAKARAKATKK